jgi:hypothetical protein
LFLLLFVVGDLHCWKNEKHFGKTHFEAQLEGPDEEVVGIKLGAEIVNGI